MKHYLFTDADEKPNKERVKISDIIDMGKSISDDWLETEAERKVIVQEQVQKHKKK